MFPKIYRKNEWGDTENEPEDMDATEIVEYQEEILAAIEREQLPNEGERGLAVYLDNDVLKGKVYSINPSVEEWDDKLWGVTEVQLHGELTQAELDEVISELTWQFSDGWGEGFEQRPINTPDGEMKSKGNKGVESNSSNGTVFGGLPEYLCWIPIVELESMKAFPIFFKDKLLKLPEMLEHIISDERIAQ